MIVDGVHVRTVSAERGCLRLIDQRHLPFRFGFAELRCVEEVAKAITSMMVRGAPAIGATAAYGLALAVELSQKSGSSWDQVRAHQELLAQTRPTAINLHDGLATVSQAIGLPSKTQGAPGKDDRELAWTAAQRYAHEDALRCKRIGEHGLSLMTQGVRVLTHCNAGWLACVDWGTALSPIYAATRAGRSPSVWADETRPRGQGRRLTAWELVQEGVPCTVLPDGAAASLLRSGTIDCVITGADRIAANGDIANKIGTYPLALAAQATQVPFYVAAPYSTLDRRCLQGEEIPIEEREDGEVLDAWGRLDDGSLGRLRVVAEGARVWNPAFDLTPAPLIRAIITEHGLLPATVEGMTRWQQEEQRCPGGVSPGPE